MGKYFDNFAGKFAMVYLSPPNIYFVDVGAVLLAQFNSLSKEVPAVLPTHSISTLPVRLQLTAALFTPVSVPEPDENSTRRPLPTQRFKLSICPLFTTKVTWRKLYVSFRKKEKKCPSNSGGWVRKKKKKCATHSPSVHFQQITRCFATQDVITRP